MKSRTYTLLTAVVAFGALTVPAQTRGQGLHHYKVVQLNTFGGPNSYFTFSNRSLNNAGVATGFSDTSVSVSPPYCFNDCFLEHTFLCKDGALTDLGGLPGVAISGSGPNYINAKGVIAGIAFNGGVDTVIGLPQYDAVVWKDGQIADLGTFGGPLSYAAAINDRDEVVGFALNSTPASFDLGSSCQNFPMPNEMRAFIWRNGVKQDLGTLGGTDSCALFINDRGQAAGHSFTDSIVNASTGFPTIHPFLWDDEKMIDLQTLGGTLAFASGLNNHAQVAGASTLAEDQEFHAFLWDKGQLMDFGSLGGFFVEVIGFNDAGEIVGKADLPGSLSHHAFLARDGKMMDLGSQDGDPCSDAISINAKGQVVGSSTDCSNFLHAFLWEDGQMTDLNAFLPSGSGLVLTVATFINNRGEIAAEGVITSGDQRAVLLVPCDENHPNVAGCDYTPVDASSLAQTHVAQSVAIPHQLSHGDMKDRIRALLMNRNRRFVLPPQ